MELDLNPAAVGAVAHGVLHMARIPFRDVGQPGAALLAVELHQLGLGLTNAGDVAHTEATRFRQ
ncbi:hypothetical protein [Streptomyces sp. NPDC059743]|uniref:hypothetical protein n=1 Tax=Streptomyces sp. NPDC059743 TaxID=3346928 RepID=UPI0036516843